MLAAVYAKQVTRQLGGLEALVWAGLDLVDFAPPLVSARCHVSTWSSSSLLTRSSLSTALSLSPSMPFLWARGNIQIDWQPWSLCAYCGKKLFWSYFQDAIWISILCQCNSHRVPLLHDFLDSGFEFAHYQVCCHPGVSSLKLTFKEKQFFHGWWCVGQMIQYSQGVLFVKFCHRNSGHKFSSPLCLGYLSNTHKITSIYKQAFATANIIKWCVSI